ncbi:hypothetical protein NKY66_10990 [Sinorhizobium meliloti]|uniref:hypothetical protein n=1 Tax=Rhizobium meliloti TaxID=382 RepID=UPI003D64A1DA
MGAKVEIGVAAALIFLSWATSTAAQDMPRYDPANYCQKVADVSGGSSMIYNSCIEMEQNAYDKRKANWSSVSAKSRNYCDEVARVSGGSYTILDSCIDMETDASASTPEFKF